MPVIRSAAKQLRQARKQSVANRAVKDEIRELVNSFRKTPTEKGLSVVASKLARAAKSNVIHKNKASRLVSRLSKLVKSEKPAASPKKSSKKK